MAQAQSWLPVYDPDPIKRERFVISFPDVTLASNVEVILTNPAIQLVASPMVHDESAELGLRVMAAGEDYFTYKPPLITLAQLNAVKATVSQTGRKYVIHFNEHVVVNSVLYAGELVRKGRYNGLSRSWAGPHKHQTTAS
ncbi:MAG: hypothetical protein ACR5LD_08395 [Symbiopectobacterium sp.]